MSGFAGPAVSDRMRYGIKDSAVRSDNLLHNFKASNGREFEVKMGNDIVFEIPSMGKGYYCDLASSYIRFSIKIESSVDITGSGTGHIRFARGPESMFRRLQIQDASGGLLETIENYNDVYALTELCCNSSQKRKGLGRFHGEGWMANTSTKFENVKNAASTDAADNYTISSDHVRWFPDLGTPLYASHTYEVDGTDVEGTAVTEATLNGSKTRPISSSVATENTNDYITYTFNTLSAIVGGATEKYLPMSAINGVRLTFGLDDFRNAFVHQGYSITKNNWSTDYTRYKATIYDPTYFLNMVQVDPTVDAALIAAATQPRDPNLPEDDPKNRLIRIHTQGWQTFSQHVPKSTTAMEYVIPIRVSSLKAVYFAFTPKNTSYLGYEQVEGNHDRGKQGQYMKSTFVPANLSDYVFYLDGKPTPATNVAVESPYSEVLSELQRSWHVAHKQNGTDHLSLLIGEMSHDTIKQRNFIMGQEFESFSGKGPVIESGKNTLNSNLQLRLRFGDGGAKLPQEPYNTSGTEDDDNRMSTDFELKIFCLHDQFLTIEPGTGVMRTEI